MPGKIPQWPSKPTKGAGSCRKSLFSPVLARQISSNPNQSSAKPLFLNRAKTRIVGLPFSGRLNLTLDVTTAHFLNLRCARQPAGATQTCLHLEQPMERGVVAVIGVTLFWDGGGGWHRYAEYAHAAGLMYAENSRRHERHNLKQGGRI
ncbi:MAG TPA: hypothetical protein VGC19_08190 [Rhodanobacter sp.]